MEDIHLYIIKDGKQLSLELNEKELKSLIDKINEYIPFYSELNLSQNFFIISKLKKYDYDILKSQIYNLEDNNFGKIVFVFKKPEKTILDVLLPYRDKQKKRCKFCNKRGHNIRTCTKRIEKSMSDVYRLSLKI